MGISVVCLCGDCLLLNHFLTHFSSNTDLRCVETAVIFTSNEALYLLCECVRSVQGRGNRSRRACSSRDAQSAVRAGLVYLDQPASLTKDQLKIKTNYFDSCPLAAKPKVTRPDKSGSVSCSVRVTKDNKKHGEINGSESRR